MSAWRTKIFEDNTACDVRREYLQMLIDGMPGAEATQSTIEAYQDDAEDPNYRYIFWAALAATQWEVGRLEESIKQRALESIAHAGKRRADFNELESRLDSPQPPLMDKNGLKKLLKEPCGGSESHPSELEQLEREERSEQ